MKKIKLEVDPLDMGTVMGSVEALLGVLEGEAKEHLRECYERINQEIQHALKSQCDCSRCIAQRLRDIAEASSTDRSGNNQSGVDNEKRRRH